GGFVEAIIDRAVPVLEPRLAWEHHSLQAELLDLLEILDALLRSPDCCLPDAEQPHWMRRAVLGDPGVVCLHARPLEGEILMVAECHADRRIDDLTGNSVAVLVGQPRIRIPAAAMEVLELDPERRELGGALACCRNQAHRDGLAQTLDV